MIKIDASKLIQILSNSQKNQNLFFILADNPIFQTVAEEKIHRQFGAKPKVFSGQNSIEDYVNYLATCGMFEPAKICFIEFPEKLTQKQWTENKKILARIPTPTEISAYFFSSTKFKATIKEPDLPKGSMLYLSYEPNDIDILKCAQALLLRYSSLSKKSSAEQTELARLTLESYSNDLINCEMHFARMEKGRLSFTAALAGNPEINGFHVAHAIALRDKHLVELRMKQCENCGQDASGVFMAVVYFLKQVAFVLGAFEETKNLKLAFEQAKIPYPAQARLQSAISYLDSQRVESFFVQAAKIELEMRLQKNPHQYLSHELINWLN